MQSQKKLNESSNTDFVEEQLLLKGSASNTNTEGSTRVESTLVSSDDFFLCPQTSNISSNFFSVNAPATMESSILSTDYPKIETLWDSSASGKVNSQSNITIIEHTVSNSSVGSFSNPPQELLKQYHQELPSIMEDTETEQCTARQRRNSLSFGKRGKKRKLSGTGSDVVAECDQNSSNSSCDVARLGDSSEVLNSPSWTECYSPYRKKTPSVVSSERGSLMSKLFTEEERQRFLAAKKKARKVEEPKLKSKFLGFLASENKFFEDESAHTSSINNSIFGDELVLSKNIDSKPSVQSEISDDFNKAQLIDMITNPSKSENFKFLNELKNTTINTIIGSKNPEKPVTFHPEFLDKVTATDKAPNVPPKISASTKEFDLITASMNNQFVTSNVSEVSSTISSENFSNIEVSDTLENLFSVSQDEINTEEKQLGKLPSILSENIESPLKQFVNITSDHKKNNTILSPFSNEDSEPLQQNVSKVDNVLNCSANVSTLCSKPDIDALPLESLLEKEELIAYHQVIEPSEESVIDKSIVQRDLMDCKVVNIDEAQNIKEPSTNSANLPICRTDILSGDAKNGMSSVSIIESQNSQTVETPSMDFSYLKIPGTVLKEGETPEHVEVHKIEPANLEMDYLVLQNTLLQNSKGNMPNNDIVIVADEFCKIGNQAINLETIPGLPNVDLNTSENQCFPPEKYKSVGFANGTNQKEARMVNIPSVVDNMNQDKEMSEVLPLDSSFPVENSYATFEDIQFLPNTIPISNGELEMLSFYADLEAKTYKNSKKSFQSQNDSISSLEQCPKTIESEDTSTAVSGLIQSETKINVMDSPQELDLDNKNETLRTTGAKKSFGGSRRVSSDSLNSIRRSSSDSCDRPHNTDSSSSADDTNSVPSKRKAISDSENVNDQLVKIDDVQYDSSAERKTALKTFKKPFTVAKKSVDEKTAFKSVIQSYFGVRTAMKTCGRTRNVTGNHVEISPEEFLSDETKSTSGSWSPLKDLSLSKSSCLCLSEEVPCLVNGETLQQTCEAEDCIDGTAVPCTNAVNHQHLLTPHSKIKHKTFCDIHLTRLKKHHCCPKCGLFCTQGIFSHCSKSYTFKYGRENHFFHTSCFIIPGSGLPPSCPHCCKFSDFSHAQLSLNDSSKVTNSSQSLSVRPEGVNLMSGFENYQLTLSPIDKEKTNTKEAKTSEVLPTEALHTMLTEITKEKSLTLRPTGKCLLNPIKNGDIKKVMQLIVNGIDPNHKFVTHKNNTPLHIAAFYGFQGIVHLLLQYGASMDAVNDDLETPLMLAVEKNHFPVVKCLILSGAQVEVKNENGSTAFHIAAKNNNIGIAKLIFDAGRFGVDIQDDDGWTPLVWACEHKYMSLVQWLLTLKADPNIQDKEKNTALHWAAYSGACEILELLLKNGCNITFVNERGDSALHIAARKDHYACVKLLLSKGASMDLLNKDGETPIMCCDAGYKSLKAFKRHSSSNVEKISLQQQVVYRDISRGVEIYPIQAINEVDQEEFIMEFRYITRNCFTPDVRVNTTINDMEKCLCKDNCNTGSCNCTKLTKCSYDVDGRLVADFNINDPPTIYECNKICHCPLSCINRVVQKGFRIPLQIFRSVDKGWGVRTSRSLPKGTFICEYIGEVITGAEVAKRSDDSYLFDLESKGGRYCIDGRYYGNVARFINHSCEPNLVSIRVFVEHQDTNFPRIAFFATRDIAALEELCFDYGTEFWVAKSNVILCTCNSSLCKYSKDSIDDTLEAYALEKTAQMNVEFIK
ncbi:hypothetical protein JTE90_023488 [Oedothorax gibbosus]|uniref:Histone-lysine N-methyltransferase EHMT1 n=1 Tax=Oedothorax gibbosus TaxID=931172 RepID=A0AAV6VQ12_9ARAC|nr:hypothetical protein JTE90_023488 [Oedothorax gibbosus]